MGVGDQSDLRGMGLKGNRTRDNDSAQAARTKRHGTYTPEQRKKRNGCGTTHVVKRMPATGSWLRNKTRQTGEAVLTIGQPKQRVKRILGSLRQKLYRSRLLQ